MAPPRTRFIVVRTRPGHRIPQGDVQAGSVRAENRDENLAADHRQDEPASRLNGHWYSPASKPRLYPMSSDIEPVTRKRFQATSIGHPAPSERHAPPAQAGHEVVQQAEHGCGEGAEDHAVHVHRAQAPEGEPGHPTEEVRVVELDRDEQPDEREDRHPDDRRPEPGAHQREVDQLRALVRRPHRGHGWRSAVHGQGTWVWA